MVVFTLPELPQERISSSKKIQYSEQAAQEFIWMNFQAVLLQEIIPLLIVELME